jgi:hypothetical protein
MNAAKTRGKYLPHVFHGRFRWLFIVASVRRDPWVCGRCIRAEERSFLTKELPPVVAHLQACRSAGLSAKSMLQIWGMDEDISMYISSNLRLERIVVRRGE